ncbi:hypothetical protein [Sphingomonas hylomeconis]|nr:hypothetical protein [Sphingomonas hylomeconis]
MEELLQSALQRRQQLRDELAAVETFIQSLSAAQQRRAPFADQADLFKVKPPLTTVRAQKSAAVTAALDDAAKMISEAGRPLTRGDLVRRLEAAGHQLEGGDKHKVLGTNIWRSGKFLNVKGVGYWPKAVPLPAEYQHLPLRDTAID